ncbi:MAG: hypothetical protein ACJAZM_000869 [Cyclobacteriaceae bacterium]|jgi:hypothetical protein
MRFNADPGIGYVVFSNVNAEDNEELWQDFKGIMERLKTHSW